MPLGEYSGGIDNRKTRVPNLRPVLPKTVALFLTFDYVLLVSHNAPFVQNSTLILNIIQSLVAEKSEDGQIRQKICFVCNATLWVLKPCGLSS